MTPGWIDSALVVLAPLALGHAALRACGLAPRADRLAWPAWAYLTGSLVHAVLLGSWFALGKPVPGGWLLPLEIGVGLAATALCRRRPNVAATPQPLGILEALAILVLLAAVILFASTGLPAAMLHSDGANIWSAKARVLFHAPGPGEAFRAAVTTFPRHADYPLLNPLLQLGAYEQVGGMTLAFQRLPIVAFYPALLLAAIAALRRHVPGLVAVAMAVLLVSADGVREIASDTYADIMLMAGLLVAVDGWLRWCESREPAFWRLALLAATFTVSSKNEGQMLVFVAALAIALARSRSAIHRALPKRPIQRLWLLLPAVVAFGQHAYNRSLGAQSDLFQGQDSTTFHDRLIDNFDERVPRLLEFFGRDVVLGAGQTRLVFALALVSAALCWRRTRGTAAMVPALATLGGLAAYGVVFAGTYWELDQHLATAGVRVSLHVAPLALLATAMMLGAPLREASTRRSSARGADREARPPTSTGPDD